PHLLRRHLAVAARGGGAAALRRGSGGGPPAGSAGSAAWSVGDLAAGALAFVAGGSILFLDRGALRRSASRGVRPAAARPRMHGGARCLRAPLVREGSSGIGAHGAGGRLNRALRGDRRPLGRAGRWRGNALRVSIPALEEETEHGWMELSSADWPDPHRGVHGVRLSLDGVRAGADRDRRLGRDQYARFALRLLSDRGRPAGRRHRSVLGGG